MPCFYSYPSDERFSSATVTVQTGVEDANYPKENLNDGDFGSVAKLTGTSGAFQFAFAGATRIDLVSLGSFNVTAATIQANSSASWGAPPLSEAFTIPATSADGHRNFPFLDLRDKTGYLVGGYQYWRLVLSGSSPVAIGGIWGQSQVREFQRFLMLGMDEASARPGIVVPLVGGATKSFDFGTRVRTVAGLLRPSGSERAALREWQLAAGTTGRHLFVLDPSVNDALLVRFSRPDLAIRRIQPAIGEVVISLVQDAFGVAL